MIIQIIGLPCVGKTFLIKQYLKTKTNIEHVDIRNFSHPKREEKLINYICKEPKKYIIESACGIQIDSSIVIEIKKNNYYHQKNMKKRNETISENDLFQIKNQMIPADFVLYDNSILDEMLDYYFN